MVNINPYLIFNGQCEEAFLLYKSVFGGEFQQISKFGDMPAEAGPEMSEADKNRVMHVSYNIGNSVLMGSDSNTQSGDVSFGNNFSISINAESRTETERIFNGLSKDGKITMPLQDTFWGAYFGMFTDKFGINWMVNFDEIPHK
ncbi:MAG: VOC family protein [Limnohabitans sp.]|nr:VOC family protein [Limnohabitans sp.]